MIDEFQIIELKERLDKVEEQCSSKLAYEDLQALNMRIDELEDKCADVRIEDQTNGQLNTDRKREVQDAPVNHPFEIFYSATDAMWFIYLPDMCVINGGNEVKFKGGTVVNNRSSVYDGYAEIISLHETLYGHVIGGEYTIDGESTASGSSCNFKIAGFVPTEEGSLNELGIKYVSGVVIVGGSGYPKPYDINSAGEKNQDGSWKVQPGTLENCVLIAGSVFCGGPGGNVNSYPDKIVAIKCAANSNTFTLEGYASMAAIMLEQGTNNSTIIPLYKMGAAGTDGTCPVEVDYRSIPHADTWSFFS